MRPGGPGGQPPGWGPPPPGPPGFLCGFCDVIGSCLSSLCCCLLIRECFGRPLEPPEPPGPPGPSGPPRR
ncbi:hypothetical protein ACJRO7_011303 [Eucalyptus globulus]|uniref:Uncharacterized protein n=1 Tax=Eucalyptus globulus TaxID=34317 RepID=A0ABD3LFJ8_EUCGL